ncbi:MAG TPA: flagellar basal body P-ring formation chaperone FlgA [bacterium]|nr:flagellar basal body P-ring formation chaperone FlgA [bacterium]
MSRPPLGIGTAVILALLAASDGLAADRSRVDESEVRAAIEAGWPDHRADGQSLEIEFAPPLLGEPGGTVRVHWPDPPLSPGPRALTVAYERDGHVLSRALANVQVRQEITVWVLHRDVERGATVTAADLYASTRVWDRDPRRAVTGTLPEGGFVARRDLVAGSWIRHTDVRVRPDVEAGDDIHLVARRGAATVTVPTSVRRGGSLGDSILVLNPLTGSVVRARLVSRGRAELAGPAERSAPR